MDAVGVMALVTLPAFTQAQFLYRYVLLHLQQFIMRLITSVLVGALLI